MNEWTAMWKALCQQSSFRSRQSDTRKRQSENFGKCNVLTHKFTYIYICIWLPIYIHMYMCVFIGRYKMTKEKFVISVYFREWPLVVYINICTFMRTFGHMCASIFVVLLSALYPLEFRYFSLLQGCCFFCCHIFLSTKYI